LSAAEYKRGEVYWVKLPMVKHNQDNDQHIRANPKPHTVIHGWHMAVILTDHDQQYLSHKHTLVIPISKSKSAVSTGSLVATHIPLEVEDFSFLDEKSYALAFQPITVPSHWILNDEYAGQLDPETMTVLSQALLITTGSTEDIQQLIDEAVERKYAQLLSDGDTSYISSDE